MSLLEDVTNTVNRLVTAFKMPDGTSAANQQLAGMQFPQFSRTLPYRDYDRDSGMFINTSTVGFILEARPLLGANEQMVLALENLVRTKLPRNTPLSFHLVSSKAIGNQIDRGLQDFRWAGDNAAHFNKITQAYYQRAASTQFDTPTNLPLTLRDYRVYISYCEKSRKNKKDRQQLTEILHLLKVIRASLDSAQVITTPIDDVECINMIYEMVNHNPDSLYQEKMEVDQHNELNYQCVDTSFDLKVFPEYIKIGLNQPGKAPSSARVMNFMLEKNPDMFMLWQGGDNISNLLSPDLSISCPFIVTMTLLVEEQEAAQNEANLKFMERDKKANTSYAKLLPNVKQEAKEWGEIRTRLSSNQSALVRYYYNVTTFCKDDDETALLHEQQVINTYLKNGIRLYSPRFHQMRNFMAMFPFMAAEGLWNDLKVSGATCRAESFNVVNLLPIIADNRLSPGGLLAPSYRNQLSFLDLFTDVMGNTNYNMGVCGTSGAGKTGLIQPVIRQVLDSGGNAWVFDMGDGYKSLCENVGGTYLDGTTLKFNPFANVTSDNIDASAERIRDQLSVMASPNGNLDEVHEGLLLQAVKYAWVSKGNRARIDDVVEFMHSTRISDEYKDKHSLLNRLDDMIVLLDQYTTKGIYGEYFNSDKPSLTDDAKMVVLELGGLEDKPSLLVAVMFSLIIYIENKMYRSPRGQKKICVIDEGWKLLNFKNDKVGSFIEKGYRTARRHTGAYITITQNIKDFDSPDASSAAKAAWGNSSYKIILKQSAQEFKKYNQEFQNAFTPMEQQIIARFGDAKKQWFSSFMLRVEDITSWHRLFVDPLSRAMFSSKGEDFEFIKAKRKEGAHIHQAVYELANRNFPDEMKELESWEMK